MKTKRSIPPADPERRATLIRVAEELPEVVVSDYGTDHLGFCVRKKTFAYYLDDHHGDGLVAVCVKSTLDRQRELLAKYPARYTIPAYLGPRGWVSLRLDLETVDWNEVTALVVDAYRMQAPKKLLETFSRDAESSERNAGSRKRSAPKTPRRG